MNQSIRPPRILAIASNGGHWHQLMQISTAFEGSELTFACTDAAQAEAFGLSRVIQIGDYNKKNKRALYRGLCETAALVFRLRPDVVVSTGAAPGLLCLFWGRLIGARTIWIDSIANAEQMSLSGRLAAKFCHLTLTQWPHVAAAMGGRVQHAGRVM